MVFPELFVGVDGGGSACRVRVVDGASKLVGSAVGGSSNVYLDPDRAIAEVRATLGRALPDHRGSCRIALGLAGVSSPAIAERVRAALGDFGEISVVSDGTIACLGAHGGRDGGLVIAGTGSAAVLHRHGVTTGFGGRGFILGDDGSGAQIGRAIWRRALRAADSMEPATPLLRSLMGQHDDSIVAVTRWARTATSRDFAAVVPDVFAAAVLGDTAALAVVEDAARSIGELVAALRDRGAPRIALVGGLAVPLGPHLADEIRALLSPPLADALAGALILAGAPSAGDAAP